MYPITSAVKSLFDAEQRQVLRITGTDKNGTSINITDADVLMNGFNIDRYCCNGEKLEVGTAIAAQMILKLNNTDDSFSNIVFEGVELFAEIGIADWTQNNPTINYIPCGYFTPDMQPRRLNHIDLTCLDRMTRFDMVVESTDLTLPATVAGLVGQINTLCGVTLAVSIDTLPNADVVITELPTVTGDMTYRNLLQWCAGIMATNAWFDWNGLLRFTWYGTDTGYETTTENRFDSDYYEEDLTITGAVYTNSSGVEIVEGTDDYAIDLTGNALAGSLIATVLPEVNTAVNGLAYRPLTAAVVNAPYLWPMDAIAFTDKDGNTYSSVLTNVAFSLNGTTALESKGLTYAINKRAQPKGVTKEQAQILSEVAKTVEDNIDASLTQEEIFNRLTDNGAAQGLFLTQDGQLYINASYIYSGLLTLGGLNNENGILQVVDADGNVVGRWNNRGISILKGEINLPFTVGNSTGTIALGGITYPLYATYTDSNGIEHRMAITGDGIYIVDVTNSNYNYLYNNRIFIRKQNQDNAGIPRIILEDDVTGIEVDINANSHGMVLLEYVNNSWVESARYGYDAIVPGTLSVGDAATTRTNLGITPANIGALPVTGGMVTGAVARKIDKDFDTPPSSQEYTQVLPITDEDNAIRGGVYMVRNTDGSYQAIYGTFKPGVGWNYIAPKINADDSFGYDVNRPNALKAAIGLGNTNNSLVLTATTGAALYTQLNALPISPTNGAGVTCYINNAAMKLLTGNTALTTVLHGVITRFSTTRFKVFGMYGDTGYLMYWAFDITSAGAITPTTVYKLQGTAM